MTEKSIYEQANEIIKGIVPTTVTTNPAQTGMTYFLNPKQRLCKVVLTKKALRLECNIELTDKLIKKLEKNKTVLTVEIITKEVAKKKKYGTMKNLITAIDTSIVKEVIEDMLATYNK
jgi:hypothetical protein